ncbi:MAG: allantoate amidohydrolase [Anaerolineales bacterium]|jgi:N-carbamoyl-L-amino-acid hydrolase
MPAILFVCTANQFRSPIAAACFSKKLASMGWKGDWMIRSAGTWTSPGEPALPAAVAAARKIGVSLDGHETCAITPELISVQDLILVMESGHKEALQHEFPLFSKRVFLLSEVIRDKIEDIQDPVKSDTDNFIESANQISDMIERGFYRICGKAIKNSELHGKSKSALHEAPKKPEASKKIQIDKKRLLDKLEALGKIGSLEAGGVSRLALSEADKAGRDLIVSWMDSLGLQIHIDKVGNILGLRPGEEDTLPVMLGSHIDTVTVAGRYDGSYGVLAALEVIQTLNDNHIKTNIPLAVAVFTNEEGVRYNRGMLGSSVYVKECSLEQAYATQGIDGSNFGEDLERIGYAGSMETGAIRPYAFIELHVEQGPILDRLKIPVGIVERVTGITWLETTVTGRANHAGTTPIDQRQDAGLAAAKLIASLREIAADIGGEQRATCGMIAFEPNAINVIPGKATFTVDLRNSDGEALAEAEERLYARAKEIEASDGVEIAFHSLEQVPPVEFDQAILEIIHQVTEELGIPSRRMISGAGHDAQLMAAMCPTAMIFVPSREGISHSPDEFTSPEDLETGANVLLHTALKLAA